MYKIIIFQFQTQVFRKKSATILTNPFWNDVAPWRRDCQPLGTPQVSEYFTEICELPQLSVFNPLHLHYVYGRRRATTRKLRLVDGLVLELLEEVTKGSREGHRIHPGMAEADRHVESDIGSEDQKKYPCSSMVKYNFSNVLSDSYVFTWNQSVKWKNESMKPSNSVPFSWPVPL